ncbi:MAG: MFS transporter [Acidimicrobiales bacterium]
MTTIAEPRTGTPRSAFANRAFRWVFLGAFASNIGTWMQNVALLALANRLGGPEFVGLVTFAQLGPMLVLSPFGGVLADRLDRKVLMITAAAVQLVLSVGLAIVAHSSRPSHALIVAAVGGIGIAAAANAPAAQATLPALVPREDLGGAVALNSAQMNASRVLGPLLAVIPFLHVPSAVFLVNAATYLFVIVAVAVVQFDSRPRRRTGHEEEREGPLRELAGGLAAAKADPVIGRALATVAIYSLCSLVFIYQMAGLASDALHLRTGWFQLLFATFGLGAAVGAIAVGTVLRSTDRTVLVRVGLGGFAVGLAVFGSLSTPAPAFPAVAVTGFFYFVVITALSTAIQHEVTDHTRGRVMGLWMMAWAGLVPVGSYLAGAIIPHTGYRPVLWFGAAVAFALIALADLRGAIAEPPDPVQPPDFL